MKSEAGLPCACFGASGVPISALATAALGRSAEGRDGGVAAGVSFACTGATALAAPATATPVRKLRRLTACSARLRAMVVSSVRMGRIARHVLIGKLSRTALQL